MSGPTWVEVARHKATMPPTASAGPGCQCFRGASDCGAPVGLASLASLRAAVGGTPETCRGGGKESLE